MVIIVLTQGLKKQSFEAPTEPKARGSSPFGCTSKQHPLRGVVLLCESKGKDEEPLGFGKTTVFLWRNQARLVTPAKQHLV